MSTEQPKCPLCFQPVEVESERGDGTHYNCSACGSFGVSDFLDSTEGIVRFGGNERIKLKHLLTEHRLKGGAPLFLDTDSGGTVRDKLKISVEEVLGWYPKTPLEYYDRALENLSRLVNHPVAYVTLQKGLHPLLFTEGDGCAQMMDQLETLGYLKCTAVFSYQVKPKGWERLQQIQRPGRESKQAFVAMWFDPSQAETFDQGIKPAIEADGAFSALRIDRKDHNNRIDDEMIAEIRRSRFLVADLSGQRHNVYYEAGFAQGLNIPVIYLAHESETKEVKFDIRQYSHIVYTTSEDLREKLKQRIRATIV